MKVLVTGNGSSGSWRIRGEQLGGAIGATVIPKAIDVALYDLIVLVKRPASELVQRAHSAGVPVVYDMVDAWPQPAGNSWNRDDCTAWMRRQLAMIRPTAVVAATRAMAEDLRPFKVKSLCVPHHARPGLEVNPIREHVSVVGYEGNEAYLGRWRAMIEAECARRGWRFVVNPPGGLVDMDIVLALRDADGYAARHWKSNVKLANAQGSGTPFIGCREAGYTETAIGNAEKWADNADELKRALDALTPQGERRRSAQWMLSVAPRLDSVARAYSEWLVGLCKPA